ncbi:MAG: hypothetical protein ACXABD_08225, partial [Candidatus Thorarchaeota archaeon]
MSNKRTATEVQNENSRLKMTIDTLEHQLRITERALERANLEVLKLRKEMQHRISLDITEKKNSHEETRNMLS